MGRALLLLCSGVIVASTISMNATSGIQRDADRIISMEQADVLARQIAQSALNARVADVQRDFMAAGAMPVYVEKPSQGGTFDLTSSLTNGHTAIVTAVGRYRTPVQRAGRPDTVVTTSVRLQRTMMLVSPLDAAVVLESPDATVAFGATGSYAIDGQDTPAPGTGVDANDAFDKFGLLANNAVVGGRVLAALRVVKGDTGYARITGLAPGPTRTVVPRSVVAGRAQAQIQTIFDEARLHPNRVAFSGNTTFGTRAFGSAATGQVVVVNGDLTVSGTVTGHGALIVNGDLTVATSGALKWQGLVMAKSTSETNNLTARIGGQTAIYGGLVLMQGSSAFVMPVDGRIKVRYVSSNAGLWSSVWFQPYNQSAVEIAPPGSNRTGDKITPVTTPFVKGQQMNFYIGVHRCTKNCDKSKPTVTSEYYKHFARGYSAPSGRPYAFVTQPDPFLWRIAFEDIDESIDAGFGRSPDWDYDKPGQEDQVIEVEVQCRRILSNGTQSSVEYEKCTPRHPEVDQSVALVAPRQTLPSYGTGNRLELSVMENARVSYSSEAISRVGALLASVRKLTQIVILGDIVEV